ncbi:MAG: hypothetical protein WBB19_04640 [Desulforhopalus sp.]
MKIIQARIRGLGTFMESSWFDLNPHLNIFQFPEQKYGRSFLRIIQTINPTYAIKSLEPFSDFPKYSDQNGHTKRLNPAKRTVALAVFSATPSLVKELADVDDLLYETDRIEVGRRLDYSRWINFVELASSTRWSEISDDIQTLLNRTQHLVPDQASAVSDIIKDLKPVDRIKDTLQNQLVNWLQNLPPEIQKDSAQLIETTTTAVLRAEHFHAARNIVRNRLPLFVELGCPNPTPDSHQQQAVIDANRDEASPQHLLDLISRRVESLGGTSNKEVQIFLNELNERLEALQFTDMSLRIDRTKTGDVQLTGDNLHYDDDEPLSSLRQMQAKACLAIAFSRTAYRTEPILLFTGPDQSLPDTLHGQLADFIINISNTCQCLYSFSGTDIFPKDIDGRRYRAEDLVSE